MLGNKILLTRVLKYTLEYFARRTTYNCVHPYTISNILSRDFYDIVRLHSVYQVACRSQQVSYGYIELAAAL